MITTDDVKPPLISGDGKKVSYFNLFLTDLVNFVNFIIATFGFSSIVQSGFVQVNCILIRVLCYKMFRYVKSTRNIPNNGSHSVTLLHMSV